jgi:bifunctional DNase/RNase
MEHGAARAMALLIVASACSRAPATSDASPQASGATAPVVTPKVAPAAKAEPVLDPVPAATEAAQPERNTKNDKLNGTPRGFIRVAVRGVAPTTQGNAVLLVDESRGRAVPVFVGDSEALSIQLRLEKRRYARPLTHDLLDTMLARLGGRIDSVRVEKLENNVFFGIVVVREGARRMELDARTSDAVALAVGCDAPIFVSERVLERAGVSLDDLEKQAPEDQEPAERGTRPDPITL